MKNISVFILFLLYVNIAFASAKLIKSKQNTQFVNEGYVKTRDIAAYENHVWLCTTASTFFKHNGLNTTISGTAPDQCARIATNKNGDLYVVNNDNKLFLLRRVADNSHVWSTIAGDPKVVDVSVSPNNDVVIVSDKGEVHLVTNDKISKDPISKEKFGDKCRIAASFEKELVVFLVNENKEVFRLTAADKQRLYPSVLADDLAVSPNFHLYLTSKTGVYRKKSNQNDVFLIKEFGIGENISVGGKTIWVVGYDNFPYSAQDSQ